MGFLRVLSSWTKAISADGVKADWSRCGRKNGCLCILKRNGRVDTVVVDNAKSDTLMPVIKQKIMPDSIVYTDSMSSYDKLDVSGFIHYHINHSKEFADRQNHINCRNQQRCLHFSDFGCRPNWQVLPLVKTAARHGEAA